MTPPYVPGGAVAGRVRAVGDGVDPGWPCSRGPGSVAQIGGRVGEAAFAAIAPGGRFSGHGTPSGQFAAINPSEARRRGVTVRGIGDVQLSDSDHKRLTEEALAESRGRAPHTGDRPDVPARESG